MLYDDTVFTRFYELLNRELGETTAERMLPALHGLRCDLIEVYTNNMSYQEVCEIIENGFGDQNPSPDFENLKAFVTEHQNPPFKFVQLSAPDDEYDVKRYETSHGPFTVLTNPDGLTIMYFKGKTIGHCYADTSMYAELKKYTK